MTSINVLKEAKEKGSPWDQAKGYDTFSPVSEFLPVEKVKDPQNLDLW
jgi:acylpyruvate hydrolase